MEHNGPPLQNNEFQSRLQANLSPSAGPPKQFRIHNRGAHLLQASCGSRGHAKVRNKFREAWLLLPEFKDWLSRVPGDPYASSCTVCNSLLNNYGKSELQKHGRGKRHLQNLAKSRTDPLQVYCDPEVEQLSNVANSRAETSSVLRLQSSSTHMAQGAFLSTLSGPLSHRYIQELTYFSGVYHADHVTATQWFQKFERIAKVAGWDESTALRVLPLRLEAQMEETFTRIESEYGEALTFEAAKQLLMEYWSTTSLA